MAEPKSDHLSRVLERAWAEIHWRHPEVPHVIAVVGRSVNGRRPRVGHLLSSSWEPGPHGVAELVVYERLFEFGATAVLGALLHEAAHGLAAARGVDDSSGHGGRYHTADYRSMATELGLDCRRDRRAGWSVTEVPSELAARYRGVVRRLSMVAGPDRPSPTVSTVLRCLCGRSVGVSLGVLARGSVLCRVCGGEFTPVT